MKGTWFIYWQVYPSHLCLSLFAGMLIASHIIGANQVVVYIRAEYPESRLKLYFLQLKTLGDHLVEAE